MRQQPLPGLSIAEAALRLGVGYTTVWSWVTRGLLPATQHGGNARGAIIRIDARDLARFKRPKVGRPRTPRSAS